MLSVRLPVNNRLFVGKFLASRKLYMDFSIAFSKPHVVQGCEQHIYIIWTLHIIYVYIYYNIWYIYTGSSTVFGFMHLLGVLDISLMERAGGTVHIYLCTCAHTLIYILTVIYNLGDYNILIVILVKITKMHIFNTVETRMTVFWACQWKSWHSFLPVGFFYGIFICHNVL